MNDFVVRKINEIKILALAIAESGKRFLVLHYVGVNARVTGQQIVDYDRSVGNGIPYHIYLNSLGDLEVLGDTSEGIAPVLASSVGGIYWGYMQNALWCQDSLQICFECLKDLKFNLLQEEMLLTLFSEVVKLKPEIQIAGHRDMPDVTNATGYRRGHQKTECPGFEVKEWLRLKGFNEANIFNY